MKKVLFYIDMLSRGGAQRVMSNLTNYFADRGYETVLANDFVQEDPSRVYAISSNVKRVYLRQVRKGNPILKNIERIWTLRRMVKEEKPDLVLSFLGGPNIRMLLATVGLKVKKVVSVRNDPNREYGRKPLVKFLVNRLFTLADGYVFQTKDAAAYFLPSIQNSARIILNPVNESFYSVDRHEHPAGIITFGRFEAQKNHTLLLDAFSLIANEFPQEDLTICGAGPMLEQTKQYCAQLGLQDRVNFPGNVENVGERLACAKLFVLSSDYEGMPNALMEAMVTGTPSVSTDCPCGGPATLIENASQGILVPCGDKEALADAMRTVLADDTRQREMGQMAKQRAEQFKPATIFAEWEEYFHHLFG